MPLLVGGSGLYVRAALDRLEIPPTDPDDIYSSAAGAPRLMLHRIGTAQEQPVAMMESGPVAGMIGAGRLAGMLGLPLERTESEEGSAFGAALLAGVRAGVFETSLMTWYPNCVLIGPRISPGFMSKTAASNSGTICPFPKGGSCPPFPLPDGSSVFSLASFAKSAFGCFAFATIPSAFAFAAASPASRRTVGRR